MFLSLLVTFVFALIGMRFYSCIDEGKYRAIDKNTNFKDFWHTTVTLFEAETGENWNMLMRDTMDSRGWFHCFYWILFVMLKTFVLLQIIIAVIFEKLESA